MAVIEMNEVRAQHHHSGTHHSGTTHPCGSSTYKKRPVVSMKPRRAGIIPFAVHPETKKLWFCLAKDSRSLELGDFGGGVKCYETPFSGAVREFNEETLGSFGLDYHYISKNSQFEIKRKNASIFFVKVPWEIVVDVIDIFRQMYKCVTSKNTDCKGSDTTDSVDGGVKHEVCDIVWINENTFNDLLITGQSGKHALWGKVKAILSSLNLSKISR
jgi:hypothetical protein